MRRHLGTSIASLLALFSLGAGAHCNEPCPKLPSTQHFEVVDPHAAGARLLPWTLWNAGSHDVKSADIVLQADRQVVVALASSRAPAEIGEAIADPSALATRVGSDPGRGSSVLPLFVTGPADREGKAHSLSAGAPEHDALLVIPLDRADDAPYRLAVRGHQRHGPPQIERGHHGQCYQPPGATVPRAFVDAATVVRGTPDDAGQR